MNQHNSSLSVRHTSTLHLIIIQLNILSPQTYSGFTTISAEPIARREAVLIIVTHIAPSLYVLFTLKRVDHLKISTVKYPAAITITKCLFRHQYKYSLWTIYKVT